MQNGQLQLSLSNFNLLKLRFIIIMNNNNQRSSLVAKSCCIVKRMPSHKEHRQMTRTKIKYKVEAACVKISLIYHLNTICSMSDRIYTVRLSVCLALHG